MFEMFVDSVLLPALYSVLVAVIPIVAGFVTDAVRKWAVRQKAEWSRAVLSEAADAVDRAVDAVEQTYAKHQRDADGRLDGKQARIALNRAVSEAYAQLGRDSIDALTRLMGGPDEANVALKTMVEAAVGRKKRERVTAAEFTSR